MKTLFKQFTLWLLIFNSTAYGVASKGLHNFSDSTEFAVKSTLPAASMETGFSEITKEKQLNNVSKIKKFWNQHRGAIIVGLITTAVSAAIIIKMRMYIKEISSEKEKEKLKSGREIEGLFKQLENVNSLNKIHVQRIDNLENLKKALEMLNEKLEKENKELRQKIEETEKIFQITQTRD